jgi:hypothetical protein
MYTAARKNTLFAKTMARMSSRDNRADLENGNPNPGTSFHWATRDELTDFTAVLGVDWQEGGVGHSEGSTLDSMNRDPRFAELDRLIAEEELYRPKGLSPAPSRTPSPQ